MTTAAAAPWLACKSASPEVQDGDIIPHFSHVMPWAVQAQAEAEHTWVCMQKELQKLLRSLLDAPSAASLGAAAGQSAALTLHCMPNCSRYRRSR